MARIKTTIFWSVIGGFGGGVALRSLFDFGSIFPMFLLLLALALLVEGLLAAGRGRRSVGLFFALALAAAALGVLRLEAVLGRAGDSTLASLVDERVRVEGLVAREPDESGTTARIAVHLDTVVVGTPGSVDADKRQIIDTGVLAIVDRHTSVVYGDRVLLSGKLTRPEAFQTDTGRTFDYPAYLAKDGIYYQLFRPDVEVVAHGEGSMVKRWLFGLKYTFLTALSRTLPEPHASLAAGLIVGAKQSLGEELLDDFRAAGLVHIIVLSGYNLSIVASAFGRMASMFLQRSGGMIVGAFGIVAFAVLVGGGATVVRASVMALIALLARATGRAFAMGRALAFAGCLMLLHNPLILFHDPSFQLSFLATLSLVVFAPTVEARLQRVSPRFGLREILVATLSTQLFVLPLLLYQTGNISLWSLPANLLVLPLIPVTMLTAAVAGGVAMVSGALAFPIASVAGGLLSYELAVVRTVASLPFARLTLPAFPLWAMFVAYLTIGTLLLVTRRNRFVFG